jgi:hypothetical protein
MGVYRSNGPLRGFLSRKTTPRGLCQSTNIVKPLSAGGDSIYKEMKAAMGRS